MRVLRIEGDGLVLDLHPQVSVVHGLDAASRARLVAALAALAAGRGDGLTGLIEVDGERMPLEPGVLAGLHLRPDLDPVVRPGQLPGSPAPSVAAGRLREVEIERAERARRLEDVAAVARRATEEHEALVAEVEAAEAEAPEEADPGDQPVDREAALDAARQRLAAATAARLEAERAVATIESAKAAQARPPAPAEPDPAVLRDAEATHTAARGVVAQVKAALDEAHRGAGAAREAATAARRALTVAREELAGLEPPAVAPDHGAEADEGQDYGEGQDDGEGDDEGAGARDALLERRAQIETDLVPLVETDPAPVAAALAEAEAERSAVEAPTVAPDPFVEPPPPPVHAQGGDDPQAVAVVVARMRIEQARLALREAAGGPSGPLTPDDVQAVEAAHDRVVSAQDRANGKRPGSRSAKRLEVAVAEERAVLDRLGFVTYAAYVMASGAPAMAKAEDPLDSARADLAAAEAALRDAEAGLAPTEPAANDPAEDAAGGSAARLRTALGSVGLAVEGADLSVGGLIDLARAWLSEQEAATARRAALVTEQADLERRLAELDHDATAARARPADQAKPATARAERAARDTEEAEARRRAEQRVGEAEAAVTRADEELSRVEATLAARIAELEAEVARAQAEVEGAATRLADLEQEARAAQDAPPAAVTSEGDGLTADLEQANVARVLAAAAEREAVDALQHLEAEAEEASSAAPPEDAAADARAERDARLAATARARAAAEADVRLLTVELEALDQRVAELRAAVEARRPSDDQVPDVDMEDVEWYLLARLASHRGTGAASAVPMVLDDPFGPLGPGAGVGLVQQLARMAAAVQLVVISDEPELAAWAEATGEDRAALISS